ncbi:MAG TPA: hypothetical protein ENO38_05305 [Nitrososphaeria archaeon]|jgi:hypothetical protein|nr:hypothetical protein [Conexivisphaerales archaeon]HEU17067.1 hypothetical protein [Nitrososphaeria archaeon]
MPDDVGGRNLDARELAAALATELRKYLARRAADAEHTAGVMLAGLALSGEIGLDYATVGELLDYLSERNEAAYAGIMTALGRAGLGGSLSEWFRARLLEINLDPDDDLARDAYLRFAEALNEDELSGREVVRRFRETALSDLIEEYSGEARKLMRRSGSHTEA